VGSRRSIGSRKKREEIEEYGGHEETSSAKSKKIS
jgi:hypothetical protein